MLNKVKPGSQMYQFLNDYPEKGANRGYTWNPIKGKCPHACSYCYAARTHGTPLRLDEKALKDNLGTGNFIFVGSSTDMWAYLCYSWWIELILIYCCIFDNRYLFQTKAPQRFNEPKFIFPPNNILGTTIETNRLYDYTISKAPPVGHRVAWMKEINLPKMVSIEPIMDFDLEVMVQWIREINPEFVSIGADSGHHHLPEPTPEKVERLIGELKQFTRVIEKSNLKRLTDGN